MRQFHQRLFGSLRRRLILSVALVHALMMTLFVWDLTSRQEALLLERRDDQASALAQALATAAGNALAAMDLAGMQELVQAQGRYPDLAYAMLCDRDGHILAHTQTSRIGQYLLDLPPGLHPTVIARNSALLDVAYPVQLDERALGWARVGIGQDRTRTEAAAIARGGLGYALAAISLGSFVAWGIGQRITARLRRIRTLAQDIRAGRRDERAPDLGGDEVGDLGRCINAMLDDLSAHAAERDALALGQERLNAFFEHAHIGLVITDPRGAWVRINPRFCTLLGYTPEELTALAWPRLTHPDDLAENADLFTRLCAGEIDHYQIDKRYIRKDGGLLPCHHTVACTRNPDGSLRDVLATVQDQSDRERAALVLREEAERARALFDQPGVGVGYLTPDGHWLRVNDRLCAICGYPAARLLGLSLSDLIHPLDLDQIQAQQAQVLAGGGGYSLEARWRHADTSTVWVQITASLVRDAAGAPAYFIAMVQDIDGRKRTELALMASEERYRMLTESSLDGVWDWAPADGTLYLSPHWKAILGYADRDLPDGFETFARLLHPDDRARIVTQIQDYFAHPGPSWRAEFRMFHRDGSERWILARGVPTLDAGGQVARLFGVHIDVTEQHLAAERLSQALEDLKQTQGALVHNERLATIGTMAAGIAHELNNPLMGIINYVAFARARATDPKSVEVLTKAERGIGHITRVVRGLLGFAQARTQALGPVDIAAVLEQALELVGAEIAKDGVGVTQDLPADLPLALADPDGLRQVLVNLLLNARDALCGAATRRISIRARADGQRLTLEVQDSGPGVPEELRGRIFDPFYSTKPAGQGTGLGLAVSASILRGLGGSLTCEPCADGALFRIEVPAATEASFSRETGPPRGSGF